MGRVRGTRQGGKTNGSSGHVYKTVRAPRRRQDKVHAKRQRDGWEFVSIKPGRVRDELTFRRPASQTRSRTPWLIGALALLLVVGLVSPVSPLRQEPDQFAQVRADADAAVDALHAKDLPALGKVLAAHRGNSDFAYFFASKTDPRSLGDALGSVAGGEKYMPLNSGVDPHAYELILTDLAGVLGLATFGGGDRALPDGWTEELVDATTTMSTFKEGSGSSASASERRAAQDRANKQNLLLLISRGYWSTQFLKTLTSAYWEFDREQGEEAWPGADRADADYAPAPNGKYLTDGILALTAALTANPEASEWAFTTFKPGTDDVEGTDYTVGRFTHFLMFEHKFPETAEGEGIGTTATLTALSSAIDSSKVSTATEASAATSGEASPALDSLVLQAIARELSDNGCSWNPLDALYCAKAAFGAVWHFIQRWGHSVLDILSLSTFAPPPFTIIGSAAAGTNATWYAVEGDYADAGLALAAAVPGLAFTKIAKSVKAGKAGEATAVKAEDTANVKRGYQAVVDQKDAEAGALKVKKSPREGYKLERDGQDDLATKIRGSKTEETLDPGCASTCTGRRRMDIYVAKTRKCIEVKKGSSATNIGHAFTQIAKDVRLREAKVCRIVQWYFVPDEAGRVGPNRDLRLRLLKSRIPYVMFKP